MALKTLEDTPIIKQSTVLKNLRKSTPVSTFAENSVFAEIVEEVGQEVYNYLERFKLTHDANVVYLSSVRHYLYGLDELKLVNTVLNFRLLNDVSHIGYFLVTMNHIIPLSGHFAGCFMDYKRQKKAVLETKPSIIGRVMLLVYSFMNRIVPRIPILNKVQLLLNQGTLKCLTRNEVRNLLEKNGFRVIDMTEIDGLTFFIAQKSSHSKKKTFSLLTLWNNFTTKSQIIKV